MVVCLAWAISVMVAVGCTSLSTASHTPPATATSSGATTGAAGTEPAWAVQRADGRLFIQVMSADGGDIHLAAPTAAGGDQTNPDWSPDGMQLAFVMADLDGDDLWTVGLDGSAPRQLFVCADACDYMDDPAWSPDGARIAACLMRDDSRRHLGSLVAVDATTGRVTTLFVPADRRDVCAGPRWSPDGGRIVLELVHRSHLTEDSDVTGVTLAIVDLSRTPPKLTRLTDPAVYAATADWSPDGAWIVYSALPKPHAKAPDLFLVRPDGTDRRRLTNLNDQGISATEPTFERSSASVVFVADAPPTLRRVHLDTGKIEAAFTKDVEANHPRPRPTNP